MANRAVSLSLYRAMWRWTTTEPMRSARYAVPVEQLPLSVLASLSNKTDSLSGRAGAQKIIREAWRAGHLGRRRVGGRRVLGRRWAQIKFAGGVIVDRGGGGGGRAR